MIGSSPLSWATIVTQSTEYISVPLDSIFETEYAELE
jgi:hypothetical protein